MRIGISHIFSHRSPSHWKEILELFTFIERHFKLSVDVFFEFIVFGYRLGSYIYNSMMGVLIKIEFTQLCWC